MTRICTCAQPQPAGINMCVRCYSPLFTVKPTTRPPSVAAAPVLAAGEEPTTPSPAAFSDDELDRIRALVDKHSL